MNVDAAGMRHEASALPHTGPPGPETLRPMPQRAWLIVWGRGPDDLRAAHNEARNFAASHACTVVAAVPSFCDDLNDGVMVLEAMRHYARRNVRAGVHAWWLVPERDLDRATALLGHDITRHYRDAAGIEDTIHG